MKVLCCAYCLVLENGRKLYVKANNKVEAFDKMRLLWPNLVEGYCYRDLISF